MPDLTQDEADHCPYCGGILREPPCCCVEMMNAHEIEERQRLALGKQRDKNDCDPWRDEGGEG